MTVTALNPDKRNFAMDVIRGVAVLGILLMNITSFSGNGFSIEWNDVLAHKLTLNGLIYKTGLVLFEGKMRGLFTLLFGAGLILFISNKKTNSIEVADAYMRRMMWLLLFGIIDGYLLLWSGDILYEYALCGLFLFAFRNLRVRWMILLAFICIGISTWNEAKDFHKFKEESWVYKETSALLKQGKSLTEEQKKTREEFQDLLDGFFPFSEKYKEDMAEAIKADKLIYRSGYTEIFESESEDTFQTQSQGFYTGFYETFGTILLGMALFKLGFFEYRLKLRSYRLLCFIGIPAGIVLYIIDYKLKAQTQAELWEMYSWRTFATSWIENPARIILMLGYASALLLICRILFLKKILVLFSNVGRMALTNYIMQTVLCSLYFFGFGLGHYGEYDMTHLLMFIICIWLIQIAYSWLYLRYFKMGPLEWIWKRLTYGKGFNKMPVEESAV